MIKTEFLRIKIIWHKETIEYHEQQIRILNLDLLKDTIDSNDVYTKIDYHNTQLKRLQDEIDWLESLLKFKY